MESDNLLKRVRSTERFLREIGRLDLRRADLYGVDFSYTNLEGAILNDANLDKAILSGSDLTRSNLSWATLRHASLEGANLKLAWLDQTILNYSDLRDANLSWASLRGTSLKGANLSGADLTNAKMEGVAFGDNDLSEVKGLDTVAHTGPSIIDIGTVYRSKGNIPEAFLRGAGVEEIFITYMRSLTEQPIQFYSCFISYSSRDQEFVDRLHADLQARRVRVWFAPHSMPIGARIRPTIDESIRVYDKLLLVLSEASVNSQWVEQEVETAFAKERESEGKTVLFPVRIDDAVMESKAGWPALLKNTRNVGDFTDWKDHDSYQRAFDKLLRDLKAET